MKHMRLTLPMAIHYTIKDHTFIKNEISIDEIIENFFFIFIHTVYYKLYIIHCKLLHNLKTKNSNYDDKCLKL